MLPVLEQVRCDPSVIIFDFERSFELVVVSVFGQQVKIQYCFHHLTQSIWRKIQSLGLTTVYENDNDFLLFCGQIDAFAFLPPDEVTLKLNSRRIPPRFHPHRWKMHEVTMADQPRTNNVCEGWNNKFHSLVGHSHPTIWKLIETLQVEANRITSILIQSDRGIRQKKGTKRIHTELQARLRNICKDYKEENPLPTTYLIYL